ncbi:winged helix-turn-helix domain-containing protein [Methyloligella halotolerans]|uniref:winged helix-turn-helix domain-containing protein n=1 Tax=Methyloligella halotolerans TaxID=1177755 RepID=UPI001ABA53CA
MPRKETSWEEAIQHVLRDADGALHYSEIAERIVSNGLRKSVGATPSATVASYLSTSLRDRNSPYLRVGRGEYALRDTVQRKTAPSNQPSELEKEDTEAGALQSFGMFWKRESRLEGE